jgi:hypothetical protein
VHGGRHPARVDSRQQEAQQIQAVAGFLDRTCVMAYVRRPDLRQQSLVRDGDSAPNRFPADGRLVVASVEFGPDDFPSWERFRGLHRVAGAPLDP